MAVVPTFRASVVPSIALTTSTAPLSGSNGTVSFLNNGPIAGQPASLSMTGQFKFPLPRSATSGIGSQLTSINVSYSVPNSTITSATFALAAISFAPAQTSTAMAVTPAGFTLTTGNFTGTLTVNAPAYENGANPEYYLLTATIVVDTAAVSLFTINNIELVYLSKASADGQFTNLNVSGWSSFGALTAPTNTAVGTITVLDGTGTEAANAVTANGVSGAITTSTLTNAALATYTITWTNNKIVAGSRIFMQIASYAGTYATNGIPYIAVARATGANTATIVIGNVHAVNALNGACVLSFLVLN